MTPSNTKKSKKILISAGIVLGMAMSLQLTSPVISNPPVTGEFAGPGAVTRIFRRACYDCHSNETKLEWYDKIAPVSWQVAAHVLEARKRFNFSAWDSLSPSDQVAKLWYMVNMIDQGQMPPPAYTAVHPAAGLSATEIDVLKRYVISLSNQKLQTTPKTPAATRPATRATAASPNGIAYFADYRNWKVITATNRFDNGTMRLIYGNDIAVKALQQNTIDPWPNGAVLAKVVWNKQAKDKDGNVFPGTFNNVQFMIRDNEKFKNTEGWGFARFSTPELIPYGKTASFDQECISCHRLASANGFVFDIPQKVRSKQKMTIDENEDKDFFICLAACISSGM